MRDSTKKQLRDVGNDLIFSRDTGFIHPHRGPLRAKSHPMEDSGYLSHRNQAQKEYHEPSKRRAENTPIERTNTYEVPQHCEMAYYISRDSLSSNGHHELLISEDRASSVEQQEEIPKKKPRCLLISLAATLAFLEHSPQPEVSHCFLIHQRQQQAKNVAA